MCLLLSRLLVAVPEHVRDQTASITRQAQEAIFEYSTEAAQVGFPLLGV
jgi:hypothetical protein